MIHSYRAMIAAPPGLLRRSLRAVLAAFPHIELIGEADGCLSAQTTSQTLKPDILFISAALPENEVKALLQGFRDKDRYKPYTIVFVNTSSQKRQAVAAGADAVLWQFDTTQQLTHILNQFQASQTPSQSSI